MIKFFRELLKGKEQKRFVSSDGVGKAAQRLGFHPLCYGLEIYEVQSETGKTNYIFRDQHGNPKDHLEKQEMTLLFKWLLAMGYGKEPN